MNAAINDLNESQSALFARMLRNEALLLALRDGVYTYLVNSGLSKEDARKKIEQAQAANWQRLLERVENGNPGFAAQLDDRKPEDLPW